jgi:[ribosomal protein S5]-alanine N-acetyltransferase
MLMGERIYLRHYTQADAEELLAFHIRNRHFFAPFIPEQEESYYTLEEQQKSIDRVNEAREQDKRYTFGIFLQETDRLIGDISLFEIHRNRLQKTILGYSLDQDHNGKGYMNEAVRLVTAFAFKELGLHRIEAGARVDNSGSIRTLRKTGFQEEGIARKFMTIDGEWHDHVMFSLLPEDPIPPK